jgi:hypothetical protein
VGRLQSATSLTFSIATLSVKGAMPHCMPNARIVCFCLGSSFLVGQPTYD